MTILHVTSVVRLDSIAASLFGNMTVVTGEIHINNKEILSIRTKDPNNHSDTETGTLSTSDGLFCSLIAEQKPSTVITVASFPLTRLVKACNVAKHTLVIY